MVEKQGQYGFWHKSEQHAKLMGLVSKKSLVNCYLEGNKSEVLWTQEQM